MSRQSLSGWGRTAPTVAEVATPTSEDEVAALVATAPAVVARGLGRSYGDAAQLSGGLVIDNRGLNDLGEISPEGLVRLGAGVSYDQLLSVAMPQGWFVPVTPGTRQVTMGGAVGADVHGKSHHVDGAFGRHVTAMRLVTPTGIRQLSPHTDPDLFWATLGGLGLTGVVTDITLQLMPISTDQVVVDTDRCGSLAEVLTALRDGDDDYRFSVAWVDCMSRGRHMGRSVLERANLSATHDVVGPLRGPGRSLATVPFDAPSGLLNTWSMRAFNELWYRKSRRHAVGTPKRLTTFLHPLDGLANWNRMYGRRGFLQYQFVVPDDADEVVTEAVDRLSSSGLPSFLAVLKRFGAANPGPLSFPQPGWTLALDLPVGSSDLPRLLDELDGLVASSGGRVYLAKDSRLRPELVATMYPRLEEFRRVKATVDPAGVFTSDLARRLSL